VHDEHGAFTVDEWHAATARAGLIGHGLRACVSAWIRENRYRHHVRVTELNRVAWWLATNVVAEAEKA
jgi:hypothetical protein